MDKCKKVCYGSEKFANEEIVRYNKAPKSSEKTLKRSYFCKSCNAWHITSREDVFVVLKENKRLIKETKILKDEIEFKLKINVDKKVIKQRDKIILLHEKMQKLSMLKI